VDSPSIPFGIAPVAGVPCSCDNIAMATMSIPLREVVKHQVKSEASSGLARSSLPVGPVVLLQDSQTIAVGVVHDKKTFCAIAKE
jgi:hypothetical protein